MFRKIVPCAVLIWANLCGLAVTAHAQKVDIIMATLAPADSAWFKVMENMGADWKRISGGNVTLSIRAGGMIGDEPDSVKPAPCPFRRRRSGAGLGDIDQGVAAADPMMFDTYEELDYVRDALVPSWKSASRMEIPIAQLGRRGLGPVLFHQAGAEADDLRKLRLFTWAGNPKMKSSYGRRLAFTWCRWRRPTSCSNWRRTASTLPTTALYAETTDLYKLANYMCDVKWAPLVGATIVSKATWEKIPAAQRGPMLEAARKSGDALKGDIRAQGTRAIATMAAGQPGRRAGSLNITPPDAAALADWRKQTEAVYPKMKGNIVPADLFDEVQRLRDEYRAHARGAK